MSEHIDAYPIKFPDFDSDEGGLVVAADVPADRMDVWSPVREYPYSNGYWWFTAPHGDDECEAHRPTHRWVSEPFPGGKALAPVDPAAPSPVGDQEQNR